MENRKTGADELYLAPEETIDSEASAADVSSAPAENGVSSPAEATNGKRKKSKRVSEIRELRGANRKVFRMSDGTEQAVFYPSSVHVFDDETETFEEASGTLSEDTDGRHYVCYRKDFVAKFSREENNDELFRIEHGIHRVTVFARKNKKNKNKGVLPGRGRKKRDGAAATEILTYAEVESGADYAYCVENGGVKESIVVKQKSTAYRYPFTLLCENVTPVFDETAERIAFLSEETGDEVFYIPAPFMSDANGVVSTAVTYEMKNVGNGTVHLTVTADSDFMNAEERAFPVVIDPQIMLSGSSAMTTYSWNNGNLSGGSLHTVGTTGNGDGCCNAKRMYMSFKMPALPRNPRIKKAELVFTQHDGTVGGEPPKFGLYRVEGALSTGSATPANDPDLIDFAKMKAGETENGSPITYSFDVTTLIDRVNKNETDSQNLVMKLLDETNVCNSSITLYGSTSDSTYAPQMIVTYESGYGVNSSYRTHTHSLGRFGQGSVDLQCGNLMFESEDFAWAGNRMPVTVRHLYNSALAGYAYTQNSAIQLNTADFANMKIGYGYHLNLMQSMVPVTFGQDGEEYTGYVYTDENGGETYFRESDKEVTGDSDSQNYRLYEDVNSGDMLYDPEQRTLTQGNDTYLFDPSGRLIRITDASGNYMEITYTSGRITSVTDGAGREFSFAYNASGQLTSVTAPDETVITYTYTDQQLTGITYPDGKRAVLAYALGRPASVTLSDENGTTVYRVAYAFSGDRLTGITEYGSDDSVGATTAYDYSVASARTLVTTTEQMDADEGENTDNVIRTVYTFDDDGNTVSEYVYSEDTGNVGTGGEASGIHPFAGNGGAGVVSNINNLLTEHNFESYSTWPAMPGNSDDFYISNYAYEPDARFGKKVLRMQSYRTDSCENGVYQGTNMLPAGQYTFSAYLRVFSAFSGADTPGAYLRVTDAGGNVLAVSEHLDRIDSEYIRLIAPFLLGSAQNVTVQILLDGKGGVYADAAQLENNPYANAYNLLENGNFENGTEGWECSPGVSDTTETCFNMTRSLAMYGDLEAERNAYQEPVVRAARSTRETFTLSGWAKGYGLPDHERDGVTTPQFRLRAVVQYCDTEYREFGSETYTADFSPCTEEWQFASVQFAKSKYRIVQSIRVYCDYSYNSGTAYFDDIQLVRNSLETALSASDFVVESTGETDAETTESTEDIPAFEEAKDPYGNTLTETTFNDGEFGTIYRSFRFNEDDDGIAGNDAGNNLVEETDARGNKTSYTVDGDTSRNQEVVDRLGNRTAYEYDASGRTVKVTSKDATGAGLADVSYTYDPFDNMTGIVRGDGMRYALAYNAFHNLESIGIDGKTEKLIRYAYKNGNGRLKQMTYANGHTMKATYNSIGQMIAERWFESEEEAADPTVAPTAYYKYVYDSEGNIVRSIDIVSGKEYNYEYEEGRIVRTTESDITLSGEIVTSKSVVSSVRYFYDPEGRMTKKVITPADGSAQTVYYENSDDNTVVRFSAGGRTVTSHSKTDSFGRKVFDELQLGTDFVSRQFVYHAGKVTDAHKSGEKVKSSATTQLVSQIILSDGRTLSYEYDAEERITKITDSVDGTTEYTYDALGQLLTETRNDEVVNTMTYDNYGNILTRNGKAYTYDSTWKDLLTSYDGQAISYDAQGNPTTYLGHTLTWEKGRQLHSFDCNTYTYNANGIRTSKTVGGIKHTYTLDGTKILRETWGSNTLIPLYDNEDSVCGILYNDTPYYFIKNLQGDIIAIVDKDAQTVARYSYDAWGVCTVTQDTSDCRIATVNPFRYRGYYYDEEIGLYYLQSRYYDASLGHFFNADVVSNIGFVDSELTNNLFTFCNNNPVNETDIDGAIVSTILKVVGRMILYAAMNVGVQFLADKFLSIIYRKTIKSDKSVYISVAVQGALDGFWDSGFIASIMKAVIANLIKQFIDIVWNGKSFEPTQLCEAVFDGIMNGVLDKLSIKSPKYIKDIKKRALEKGIKGTKKLVKYLAAQKIKISIWNFGLKALKDFCYNVIKNFISTAMNILQEIVNDVINSVSSQIKEARA